ncbi:hypothetical protein [Salinicola endophyticus]|uniref:Uncharacterized protein n=1 Tax=Salinicola endophyticus TaxID=1949083 RepID=A0AB74U8C9_9GAMM
MDMNQEPNPAVFADLSEQQLFNIEDVLSNDEVSSDEELVDYFIEEGIPADAAKEAVAYRDRYLLNIYKAGHGPIREDRETLRYDPYQGAFVPD